MSLKRPCKALLQVVRLRSALRRVHHFGTDYRIFSPLSPCSSSSVHLSLSFLQLSFEEKASKVKHIHKFIFKWHTAGFKVTWNSHFLRDITYCLPLSLMLNQTASLFFIYLFFFLPVFMLTNGWIRVKLEPDFWFSYTI